MAEIPGWIFTIIGIVVGGFSYFIYLKEEKMLLFVYVGIAFLLYGLIKIVLKSLREYTKDKDDTKYKDFDKQLTLKDLPTGQALHQRVQQEEYAQQMRMRQKGYVAPPASQVKSQMYGWQGGEREQQQAMQAQRGQMQNMQQSQQTAQQPFYQQQRAQAQHAQHAQRAYNQGQSAGAYQAPQNYASHTSAHATHPGHHASHYKYCSSCGARQGAGARFCQECGQRV
jgi:hypothetical protein